MCDGRIKISKWDLPVLHEVAAALQISEKSCREGHVQNLLRLSNWEFLQVVLFCCCQTSFLVLSLLCLSLFLILAFFFFFFGEVLPWITFLLDLSLPFLKWPTYAEVSRQASQQSWGQITGQHPQSLTWLEIEKMET